MACRDEHELTCDVLVAGGGSAGTACALSAARCGAQVVLCQDRPVLGGNASSEVRMHIQGANCVGRFERGRELQTEPRESGIIEELRLETCVRNPQRSASMLDLILYEKCRAEANLTLLLNTTVIGAETHGSRLKAAVAARQSTQDHFRILADVFVDCTGDGRLGFEAGASFMAGRENQAQFGEPSAPQQRDAHRLGSSILFQARKHDRPMPFVPPRWARRFSREDLRLRLYAVPGQEQASQEYGYWWAEWGGTLDTIKENEAIRDELLAIMLGIWDHIKNGPPGTPAGQDPFQASHWALDWFGFLPGKRESRRFIGQLVLTEQDLFASRAFTDRIAYGGWMIDVHPSAGIDAPEQDPCLQRAVPFLYDIPLRCCVSRDVSNLMFAGRNISATHVAFASTRVMATCAGIEPLQLASREDAVKAIQQRLSYDDAYLIGMSSDPLLDASKSARISASSEQAGGQARNVVSGQARSVHGPRGAPPDRAHGGLHRWMSDPEATLPAWIRFEWEHPVVVEEIQLIFDTGLHRHLTLSHRDSFTSKMIWGRPQPETVRDYVIEGFNGDRWYDLARVKDNYQRLRRHNLPTRTAISSLRIWVQTTNGLDHARIVEIRVHPQRSQVNALRTPGDLVELVPQAGVPAKISGRRLPVA